MYIYMNWSSYTLLMCMSISNYFHGELIDEKKYNHENSLPDKQKVFWIQKSRFY